MRKLQCIACLTGSVALVAGAGPRATAEPVVHVRRGTEVQLTVRPLNARLAPTSREPRLVAESGSEARAEAELDWPAGRGPATLLLVMRPALPSADGEQVVDVEARLRLADGVQVLATRSLRFDERTTVLFEVYRIGDQALTFALEAEVAAVERFSLRPSVGPPVRFRLEIVRILDGRSISLESNELDTFVGEPVSYSFRLGSGPDSDNAKLTLRPLRIVGELLEIEAQLDGSLVTADDLALIGRTERVLASRAVTSSLAFEVGTPPVGYRFLITPRF